MIMNCEYNKNDKKINTPHCKNICDCVDWSEPEKWIAHFSENFSGGEEVLTYGSLETICTEPVTLCTLGRCKKCGKQICYGGPLSGIASFDDFMTRLIEDHAGRCQDSSTETERMVVSLLHKDDREIALDWLFTLEK